MFTDMIAEIVRVAGNDYKHGIAARFIRLTERHGFKFFWTWHGKCEKTHGFQKIAHKLGLAPRILSDIYEFDATPDYSDYKEFMHGYFTEAICETLRERAIRIVGTDYYKQERYINKIQSGKTWQSFKSKWRDLPFYLDDMHASNIGFMSKTSRKPVIIDFSECY